MAESPRVRHFLDQFVFNDLRGRPLVRSNSNSTLRVNQELSSTTRQIQKLPPRSVAFSQSYLWWEPNDQFRYRKNLPQCRKRVPTFCSGACNLKSYSVQALQEQRSRSHSGAILLAFEMLLRLNSLRFSVLRLECRGGVRAKSGFCSHWKPCRSSSSSVLNRVLPHTLPNNAAVPILRCWHDARPVRQFRRSLNHLD